MENGAAGFERKEWECFVSHAEAQTLRGGFLDFQCFCLLFFLFLIEGLVGEYLREVSFFSQFLTSGRNCDFSSSSSASNPKCSRVQLPEFV